MRLGTCIALELAVVASCMGGVWFGVSHAREVAGEYLEMRPAEAAPMIAAASSVEIAMPRATFVEPPPPPPRERIIESVYGAPDVELLAPVGEGKVTKIKLNHGGTSLSLRVDFESGARASFKPEQIHPQSDPRREIAAYRLDRLLKIGRVPPAKSFVVSVADLLAAAEPSHRTYIQGRLAEESLIRKGGILRGELSWWVPEIKLAKFGPHRIDEKDGKTAWITALQIGAQLTDAQRSFVAQISAVIMFDVLIDNPDRWTGANTVMSPDSQTLYFMDNTMSFSRFGFGHQSNLLSLRRSQMFPKALVERIRALTPEAIAAAISVGEDNGLAPLLDDKELDAILVRRDNMLRYIDQLIAVHGEAAVLAFPMNTSCPICGKAVDPLRSRHVGVRGGKVVAYCSAEHARDAETKADRDAGRTAEAAHARGWRSQDHGAARFGPGDRDHSRARVRWSSRARAMHAKTRTPLPTKKKADVTAESKKDGKSGIEEGRQSRIEESGIEEARRPKPNRRIATTRR